MALPTRNPIEKTATELRRSIGRLEVYRASNPGDDLVVSGELSNLLRKLNDAYGSVRHIHNKEG